MGLWIIAHGEGKRCIVFYGRMMTENDSFFHIIFDLPERLYMLAVIPVRHCL